MSFAVDLLRAPAGVTTVEAAAAALEETVVNQFGFAERVAAFDAIADQIAKSARAGALPLPAEGLAFLITFLRKSALTEFVSREVKDLDSLTGFSPVSERKSIRLAPRGLACHWIAGNVPLLAVFSWVVSCVLGNRNLIRLSSRQEDPISALVDLLAQTSDAGKEIAAQTVVVNFDRENEAAHKTLSEAADVRIAWGGREAVDAIRDLPAKWECQDLILGPRMSFAIVDPVVAKDAALKRLASDICVFDQMACSSPQFLFVKSSDSDVTDEFVKRFSHIFAVTARGFQRHELDYFETYRIQLDRARSVLRGGRVLHDKHTEWTVAVDQKPLTDLELVNRFVQIVPFEDPAAVLEFIPANVQTVVTLLDQPDFLAFTEAASLRGVCRFPIPGEGNNFENPWDGVGLVSRLTRTAIRTEQRSESKQRSAE